MIERGLSQDILHALEFEPSVNAENIGVAVKDGVVTLMGLSQVTRNKLWPNGPSVG